MRLAGSAAEIRRRLRQAEHDGADAIAMQQLAPLQGPQLPWTSFSMRPSTIVAAVSDIIVCGRANIVECGSGNSTIYIARLLALRERGRITTIEHDEGWANATRSALRREGLENADVVYAPLTGGWYDRAAIPAVDDIDLLLVDGPPARSGPRARQPALPFFNDRLTDDATVILDDAWRPDERQAVDAWSKYRPFERDRRGFAISGPYSA